MYACVYMCIQDTECPNKVSTETELPTDIRKILIFKTIVCLYLLLIMVFLKRAVRDILNRW